jgi:uncharacterized coiled-coil DUF342 family protein
MMDIKEIADELDPVKKLAEMENRLHESSMEVSKLKRENIGLKNALDVTVEKTGELYAGLFQMVRKIVATKGESLGKSQKEITQMTVDTIKAYLEKKVDYALIDKLLKELEEGE